MGLPLGSGISYAITGCLFNDQSKDFRTQFELLLVIQVVIVSVMSILFFVIMRNKPTRPPSKVATVPYQALDFRESVKAMKENKNFLLLVIAVALPFGTFNSIQILISNLFEPFGYSSSDIAFITLKLLLAGITGAILIGIIIDKTQKYKLSMNTITFNCTIIIILVICALWFDQENRNLFTGLLMSFGLFYMAYIPLCLSFGAELTFPLQPALVNGTFTLAGSASAFIFSTLGGFITHERRRDDLLGEEELLSIEKQRACWVIFIVSVSMFVAFLISLFIDEDLRRLRYGK